MPQAKDGEVFFRFIANEARRSGLRFYFVREKAAYSAFCAVSARSFLISATP